jgi:hypothetical protein
MGYRDHPDAVFQLSEKNGVGETANQALARTWLGVGGKFPRILTDTGHGRFDFLAKFSPKALALILVVGRR